jgi:radical SAM-linked protein
MRLRITFSKTGALRYIGHLDLNTIWERAARRAELPLAYTQGFHPQPKMKFASALPLGFSSRCEMVDVWINEDVDLSSLSTPLQNMMPAGIGILSIQSVDERAPALQTQIRSAEYEVVVTEAMDKVHLKQKIEEVMASAFLPRQRRGKSYDLRPLIEKLELTAKDQIHMRLSAREGATGRPEEVLSVLEIPIEQVSIERIGLIFQN